MPTVQPLQQSTLINSLNRMQPSNDNTKKRAITLISGEEVDLQTIRSNAPLRPEVVEAMKARIIELEDQLTTRPSPAKRARKSATSATDDASNAEAGPSTSTTTSTKADEKKKKVQLKKIFDQLKKECKKDTCKFQGLPKTIKIDEVLQTAEFEAMFGGKGTLIQPTPTNKPKSTVTIIEFNKAQIAVFFGAELKVLKGNRWSQGGVPVRTFGSGFGGFGSTFSKSVKQGSCDVEIRNCDVNYSKNGMKCTMKFVVAQVGGGGMYGSYGDGDSEDDDDY